MFKKVIYALAGMGLLACSNSDDPYQQTSAVLGEQVIYRAHQDWQASNQQLLSSTQAFCQGEQSLAQIRQHFLPAQQAWASLQPVLIGPLNEGNRAWQVQFWPDKKNLVARQVKQFVKANPDAQLADLERGSVVIQGLSAYEYVLFDQAIDLDNAAQKQEYCPLLTHIATHQQQLADEVLAQWQGKDGMLAQLTSFPNQRYAEPIEALTAILQAQVMSLDGLKKKLGTPLGRSNKNIAQPYQAQSWRSQASLSGLSAEIETALAVWQGAGQQGVRDLLVANHADLTQQIDAAYVQAQQELSAFKQPLTLLLADEQQRPALFALYESFDRLHRLHEKEVARALGVQLGFNAHDGD